MKRVTTILLSISLLLLLIGLAPSARAEFGVSFSTAVDTSTTILGGTGTFTDFPTAPAISYGHIAFMGLGSGGQIGLYLKLSQYSPGDPYKVMADLNTAIPGGTGTFTDFALTDLSLSDTSLTFIGSGSGSQLGVYVAIPGDPYRVVANLSTLIPGGSGYFTNFIPNDPYRHAAPVIDGSNVAFLGYGDSGQIGVYAQFTDALSVVVDLNTPIPGGTGNFTNFVPPNPVVPPNPIISGDVVAFLGFGDGGQQGIYRFVPPNPIMPNGSLTVLVDTNTFIPASTESGSSFELFHSVTMEDANVAFVGGTPDVFADGVFIPGQLGVYKDIGSGWRRVADRNTSIPSHNALFSLFGAVAIDPGYVVFEGFGPNGVHGLYTDFAGGLHKIVEAGDVVGGKTLTDFYWSQFGFSAGASAQVVFAADYSDGSHAITLATLTNGPCPHSQGYWKNNPRLWPVSSLTLGSQTYSKTELLNLLKNSTTSDASVILARQLIAAKLNIANGSDGTPVSSTTTDADSLLSQFAGKLPYKVKTASSIGKAMVKDATILNNYNNGMLSQFCGQ